MESKYLWFDMDGVLGDFGSAFARLTGVQYPPDTVMTDEEKDKKWSLLDSHPNFFLDLPWIPGAKTMVAFATQHSPLPVGILSAATRRIDTCPKQKQQWCAREIPWIPSNNINIVNRKSDKTKFVFGGSVLVDDYMSNIIRWQEAGGIGIHFQNSVQAMIEIQAIIKAPEPLFNRMMRIVKQECEIQ